MKKKYVVGFLFSEGLEKVVLVRKNKPEWQKGKLNGVGGKIEAYDVSPHHAMVREFKEETGMDVPYWDEFMKLEGPESVVYVFKMIGDVTQPKTVEAEEIEVHEVKKLLSVNPHHCVPNLLWLIPLAMEQGMAGEITYTP